MAESTGLNEAVSKQGVVINEVDTSLSDYYKTLEYLNSSNFEKYDYNVAVSDVNNVSGGDKKFNFGHAILFGVIVVILIVGVIWLVRSSKKGHKPKEVS